MKKLLRKIIGFAVCGMLFCQMNILAEAQEYYVCKEVIAEQIEKICKENGVDFELVSYDDSKKYTIEEVNRTLNALEDSLKNTDRVHYTHVETSTSARVMEANKTYTSYAYASNGVTGGATLEISCNAKINMGSISFMSISNIATRQYGSATNFVSWNQTGSSYSYLEGGRKAQVEATGTLVTEMDILGVRHRETADQVMRMVISAG